MKSYIYGVEKRRGAWCVWRFNEQAADAAVAWLANGARVGWVRWLCTRETAAEMAGENALRSDNLVDWGDCT